MEKQICLNGTWNDDKYSSPMPTIGLYIAAGTSACLLFMICDLFHGLYNRKPWIPCRFLKLNSLTLTLLAIASKLPVDLTTSMPSVQDQLSKLSGTTLICISMSFFFLSLGTQSDSERLSNMLSLTIFIITVVVNICMQLVTGVIYLFIVEHIIMMACMLLLLTALWSTFDDVGPLVISGSSNPIGELIRRDPQSSETKTMKQKLESFFKSSCIHNPEVDLFLSVACLTVCMISTLSALVLSQAALRSLVLKNVEFRCGVSDYKWSMWIVVVTQILTILVGSIATIFRWLLIFNEGGEEMNLYKVLSTSSKLHIFPTRVLSTLSKLRIISFFQISRRIFIITFHTISKNVLMVFFLVKLSMMLVSGLLYMLMLMIPFMCAEKIRKICFGEQRNGEYRDHMRTDQWIQRNCEEDMNKWVVKYRSNSPIDHLIQLLSRTPKSENPFTNQIPSPFRVSCLSVVIFIRIATFALPNALSASLIHTLDETFEIIYFIDKKMNTTGDDKNKLVMAKELWLHRNNPHHWFHNAFIKPLVMEVYSQSPFQPPLDLYFALWHTEKLKTRNKHYARHFAISGYQTTSRAEFAAIEIHYVCELIIGQSYSSINELYGHMEQLFVDMLHFFLSQLPLAIFEHLVKSPIQEREERARLVLKFLYKLGSLENKVNWSFPDGTGITTLITRQVPSTQTQVHHSLADGSSVTSFITTQVPTMSTQHIEPVEGYADPDEIQERV